ncbi:SusD/RagB family nutrient-binding outer membrane lipoprotein [Chitinophaga lutea]|uniref:SusD/RagB family nutrient-binding outer membrane lipoprotein n=1 Tax=Chitinophaga lutea TaxID=2488634 RepID=A0A3N4Q3U6_9BACT|nr:SusD/RagB family nutrient-binding outer membrane lipoprotein [Chitinophaga lutea]RPE14245.1 SusD/RagB family nutrient-binding outer membrane lipoprotein [Chitinophaga lutea]
MKKNMLYFLLVASLLSSCTGKFDDMNKNPAKLSDAGARELPFMFTRAQSAATIHRPYYQTISILMPDLYAQYFALTTTSFQTDRYAMNDGWLSRPGIITYVLTLPQLQTIFDNTDRHSGEYALTNIMLAYTFHRLTDYYGPVPYFQAGQAKSSIAYDPQDKIYDDLFKRLDSAVTNLKSGGQSNVFGSYDIIYDGNVQQWIRFANTLRLRLALRISRVDPARAKTEAEAAVAGGVMTASSHSAYIKRSMKGDDANGLSTNAVNNEFSMSSTMASYLKGYNDPRLPVYFQPAVGTGQFKGLRNGSSATDINKPGNRPAQTSNVGPRWVTWNGSTWIGQLEATQPVLHAAEAWFLRAEGALNGWNMDGTAQDLYEKGIAVSMQEWGIVDPAVINNYITSAAVPVAPGDEAGSPAVAATPVKWAATAGMQRAQIGTQKWLALYPDGVEAWAEFRRSGYPVMYPVLQSDNSDLPAGTFIKRLPYSSVEASTNAAALEKARQMLSGPDNAATRVWWDID